VHSATSYYHDFNGIFNYLPHIQPVAQYGPNQFRALYHTIELGLYRVRIYCDLQVHFDAATQTLHVMPLPGLKPVKPVVTVSSLTAQGYFTSQSIFRAYGRSTHIDYQLQLYASLPKPFGLKLIPDGVMNQIAASITDWRIREIAEGFIEQSIRAYQRPAAIMVAPATLKSHSARRESCSAGLPLRAGHAPRDRQID
jgi:hypothetical protein